MERIDFIYEQFKSMSEADLVKLILLLRNEIKERHKVHEGVKDAEPS